MNKTKLERYIEDGIFNQTTGLGTKSDKSYYNTMLYRRRSEDELEEMFRASRIARRFVSLEPSYIYKEGYIVESEDAKIKNALDDFDKRLKIPEKMYEARLWARLYGGSVLVKLVRDGKEGYEPMDEKAPILMLHVVDRRFINYTGILDSNMLSEDYGEPISYYITPDQGDFYTFHRSRIMKFNGDLLPRQSYIDNEYWHQSSLEAMFESITDFAASHHSSAILAQDFRQSVYKYSNLEELLSAGEEELVRKRAQTIDAVRSVLNAIILGENEEFQMMQNPVSGLSDIVKEATVRLCIESGIPHTLLLGDSPSGLGATGESEKNDWYDHIRTVQANDAEPKHRKLYDAELKRLGLKGDYSIKWLPLDAETPKQEAERKKLIAERDSIYVDKGVLTTEDIRRVRFSNEGFEREITLDEEEENTFNTEPELINE